MLLFKPWLRLSETEPGLEIVLDIGGEILLDELVLGADVVATALWADLD